MTVDYKTPGIYFKEQPSGVHIISGAETSRAAFIGYYSVIPVGPKLYRSYADFKSTFPQALDSLASQIKDLTARTKLTKTVNDKKLGENQPATLEAAKTWATTAGASLDQIGAAIDQDNRCLHNVDGVLSGVEDEYKAARDTLGTSLKTETAAFSNLQGKLAGISKLKKDQEVAKFLEDFNTALNALVAASTDGDKAWEAVQKSATGLFEKSKTQDEALRSSSYLPRAVRGYFENGGGACYVVNAASKSADSLKKAVDELETVLDVTILACPDAWLSSSPGTGVYQQMLAQCNKLGNRMAILDAPNDADAVSKFAGTIGAYKEFAAVYYPWITVSADSAPKMQTSPAPEPMPPCGHVAGVWCRTDAKRGVHKAPANESINGVSELTVTLTDDTQQDLNSAGINCLREFPKSGKLVWGARTLDQTSPDWKYINVRRVVNFIRESIRLGTLWAVFEPNNDVLRSGIRREVTAFLTDMWHEGALVGSAVEQAFYVICDDTNNDALSIAEGLLRCDIGLAIVRPAEFIEFRITQIYNQPS
ncbi:phage tail sheath family protein [Nocardia brasiliensis]|uniref:phage tail sheath family protein n=1 Tax=Nocardia brasiliensis TaxID=37326 RepID=UPI00245463D1|nr:phage tail sheath C-terminal domain-containing protein [Nocardia brasiliensis]